MNKLAFFSRIITILMHNLNTYIATDRWFSPGNPVSSTNKTDHHDITEILLKVALNTITSLPPSWKNKVNEDLRKILERIGKLSCRQISNLIAHKHYILKHGTNIVHGHCVNLWLRQALKHWQIDRKIFHNLFLLLTVLKPDFMGSICGGSLCCSLWSVWRLQWTPFVSRGSCIV